MPNIRRMMMATAGVSGGYAGTMWAVGTGNNGRTGLGNTTDYSSPVQIGANSDWVTCACSNSFSAAINSSGELFTWGWNGNGQLGLGDTTVRSSPVQVGSLTNWSKVSAGQNAISAVKTDGTLWCWGQAIQGGLGLGDTTDRSSPVQVGSLTDWGTISRGEVGGAFFSVKTDGTLWVCGSNDTGGLGLGNTTNYSSPVKVGALTTWVDAHWSKYPLGPS